MAQCSYATVLARQSAVVSQEWRPGEAVALTVSPGEMKLFAGKVDGLGTLIVSVNARGESPTWRAALNGNAFLQAGDRQVHSVDGKGAHLQLVIVRPEGLVKHGETHDTQHEAKGTAGGGAELTADGKIVKGRLSVDAREDRARTEAASTSVERTSQPVTAVTINAEVCFDRKPPEPIRVLEGRRRHHE
jgi:hypothetical protein